MKPKYKAGDVVEVVINGDQYRFRITKQDSFGTEPHYGFYSVSSGSTKAGWIPAFIFDGFESTLMPE